MRDYKGIYRDIYILIYVGIRRETNETNETNAKIDETNAKNHATNAKTNATNATNNATNETNAKTNATNATKALIVCCKSYSLLKVL